MPALEATLDRVSLLEAELRRRHRGFVRHLQVLPRGDGVEIRGEAVSFYAKQLVIRDVLAAGDLRIRADRIAVD